MNWFKAAVLGIIQGLTEFLPVSSSGHLVIGSKILGLPSPGLSFSIWVHVGTALATLIMLNKEIRWLVNNLFTPDTIGERRRAIILIGYIAMASIPAAIVGLFLKDIVEVTFSSITIASIGLIVTGFILQSSKKHAEVHFNPHQSWRQSIMTTITLPKAFLVGVFQAIAIVPGVSRSGLTITSGIVSGMSREDAAKFSFLLSLPAIFGSALLDIKSALDAQIRIVTLNSLIGAATSFIMGMFALVFVFKMVCRGELWKFSYYCWAIGIIGLALNLF